MGNWTKYICFIAGICCFVILGKFYLLNIRGPSLAIIIKSDIIQTSVKSDKNIIVKFNNNGKYSMVTYQGLFSDTCNGVVNSLSVLNNQNYHIIANCDNSWFEDNYFNIVFN